MNSKTLKKSRAVYLDRDGTLIEERGYISHASQICFLPGAVEAILALNQSPFFAVMVSNQSGVARGYFTESVVHEIHQHIQSLLERSGAHLDRIYYCPHFPEGEVPEYRIQCRCRKPGIGMLEEASRDLEIKIHGSYLIGDKLSDIETARRAGLIGILVLTGYGTIEWERYINGSKEPEPHKVCENVYAAVDWILKQENGQKC